MSFIPIGIAFFLLLLSVVTLLLFSKGSSGTVAAGLHSRARAKTSVQSKSGAADDDDDENSLPFTQGNHRGGQRDGGSATLRRRPHLRRGDRRIENDADDNNNNHANQTLDDGDSDTSGPRPTLTRLQKKKQEKEREREERRRALEEQEENRRSRQDADRELQTTREREEEERRVAEEAALQELRDEKKRQGDEEYNKWVSAIGVEERGEIGDAERTCREALVSTLIERACKVNTCHQRQQQQGATLHSQSEGEGGGNILVLGDVAREHGVTVEVLVQLLEKLLEDGSISGVFDDRGKFVLVAESHFVKLAEFIQQRGRVSVKELVRECNKVILC